MDNFKNKAIIYARYSSDKQKETSIEGQIRVCQEYAERKGITVIGQYVDRALTGRMDARPDFQRMVKDSRKGLFQYAIVYQFDRFARDRYDSANYKHILKQNGVKVLSAKEDIPDDPAGIMLETMLEGMAEYFSAELAVKVRRGMKESFLKGNYLGGKPTYGYRIIEQKYAIDEVEAKIVRRVFDDYHKGKRSADIIRELKEEGIKTKGGVYFHKSSLMKMLVNKKYIGTLVFDRQEQENVIPVIIDRAIFEGVQKKMENNRKKPATKKAIEPYILTAKLFCEYCHGLITADGGKNKHGIYYRYYKCSKKKNLAQPCEKTQFAKNKLENIVSNAVVKLVKDDKAMKWASKQIVENANRLSENTLLEQLEERLKDTQKKITNVLNAIELGIVDEDTKSRMIELQGTKADLQYRIDGEKLNATIKLNEDETLYWLLQFRQGNEDDKKYRERLIDTFVNKIILSNDRMIIIFNIKGKDGEQLSVSEILEDMECGQFDVFEYDSSGDPEGTRTLGLHRDRVAF